MFTRPHLIVCIALAAAHLAACTPAQPYLEPVGVPDEQLARVSGCISHINGLSLQRHNRVRVLPGQHVLTFTNQVSKDGPKLFFAPQHQRAFSFALDLRADQQYEFDFKEY